jgi:hypothetical protein
LKTPSQMPAIWRTKNVWGFAWVSLFSDLGHEGQRPCFPAFCSHCRLRRSPWESTKGCQILPRRWRVYGETWRPTGVRGAYPLGAGDQAPFQQLQSLAGMGDGPGPQAMAGPVLDHHVMMGVRPIPTHEQLHGVIPSHVVLRADGTDGPASLIARARDQHDPSISRPNSCRQARPERRIVHQRWHREEGTAFSGIANSVRLRGCQHGWEQIQLVVLLLDILGSKGLKVIHH